MNIYKLLQLRLAINFIFFFLCSQFVLAQNNVIPFNSDNWQLFNGQFIEFLGRSSLMGTAQLKEVEFENGIIEFDIAVNGERSYPGIFFRVQSIADYEHFYIRPHRAHYYTDALQYSPTFGNVGSWQLYNGEGYTAGAEIPRDKWFHVKLEVKGNQGRVFINNSAKLALEIDFLKHGRSKGWLTLNAPNDGSAYFSNFSVKLDDSLFFEPPEQESTPVGMITDWELSQPYKIGNIDFEKMPGEQGIKNIKWKKVDSETSGLVNVSRYFPRFGGEPDCIFARTVIHSDTEKQAEIRIGYSDAAALFVNGKLYFTGSSAYRQRDPSFLGIIGLFDSVYPELKEGKNEIFLIVAESFGGWGFMAQEGKAVFMEKNLTKLWESEKMFVTSESVLYDPERNVLYVTNFDQYNVNNPNAQQFISKVSLDGKIEELKWIDSLNHPLGITIYEDRLFTAERNSVAEINLEKGEVIERYPIPGSLFLNDIAIDNSGKIYISDSRKNVIWCYSDGIVEEWLTGEEVTDPNVLLIHEDNLLYGNSGDRRLKSANLKDKSIKTIAEFETGFIDGLRVDENGNYLVSLWRGKLYRVTPQGGVTKILDTKTPGSYSADFEYIKEKQLLIIPTFFGNTIAAYNCKTSEIKQKLK